MEDLKEKIEAYLTERGYDKYNNVPLKPDHSGSEMSINDLIYNFFIKNNPELTK